MQIPKPILLIPSSDCDSKLRAELRKAGYVVITTNDPASVKLLDHDAQPSDLLMSALQAITGPHSIAARDVFVNALFERLKSREVGKA